MIIFFKSGPFAWTGIIGFWIPAAVFGIWHIVMTVVLLRAIREEADSDRAAALAEVPHGRRAELNRMNRYSLLKVGSVLRYCAAKLNQTRSAR